MWFPCRASWCMLASESPSIQYANAIKTIGHSSISKLRLAVASHSPAFHLWFFIDTLLQSLPAFIRAECTLIGYTTSRAIQAAKSLKHNNRDGKFATGHADEEMIQWLFQHTVNKSVFRDIQAQLEWPRYIVTVSELQLQAIFLVHREHVLINQLQPNSLFLDDGF